MKRSSGRQSLAFRFPALCKNQSYDLIAPAGVNFMAETHAVSPAVPGNRLLKFIAFLYGAIAYLTFLVTILYAIGFVSGFAVPKAIDTGGGSPVFEGPALHFVPIAFFLGPP